MVVGAKAWFLYPPGGLPAGNLSDPRRDFNAWLRKVLPVLPERHRPIGCLIPAGELLYMPAGWVHATMNVGETVGVGVQGSYDYEVRLAAAKVSRQRQKYCHSIIQYAS